MEAPLTTVHHPLVIPAHAGIRFVPHRISLDTRFRGYDVTQIAFADRHRIYFRRSNRAA
jgi:hypothetical protein